MIDFSQPFTRYNNEKKKKKENKNGIIHKKDAKQTQPNQTKPNAFQHALEPT